jgi:hypothetical protein
MGTPEKRFVSIPKVRNVFKTGLFEIAEGDEIWIWK